MRTLLLVLTSSLLAVAPVSVLTQEPSEETGKLKARIAELEDQLKSFRGREMPTLPVSYVVSNGVDTEQLARAVTKATIPIFHSIGERRVRAGRVTLLGVEKNYVVGFTTSCTVTRQHPWPSALERSEQFNEVIAIKPPDFGFDFYLTAESEIAEDRGVALTKALTLAKVDPAIVTIESKGAGKVAASVQEGDYVEVLADEDGEGRPQSWSARTNGQQCGPEGYSNTLNSEYALFGAHPLGCLVVAHSADSKGKDFTVKSYTRGGVGFFVKRTGQLEMCINDKDRANNSGSLRVEVRVNRGIGKTTLQNIRKVGDKVLIKSFGRNDVVLVYFPINKGNYFGERAIEKIPTLGIENPTRTVDDLLGKATNLFGHKFLLYCERCDEEVCKVPELEQKAFERGYEAGFKRGKQEGVNIFVSSLIRPLVGMVSAVLTGGLPLTLPGNLKDSLAQGVTRLVMDSLGSSDVTEYLRPGIKSLVPSLAGLLDEPLEANLVELSPRSLASDDIAGIEEGEVKLKDGTRLGLAGIALSGPEGEKALMDTLKSSTRLLFVPHKKKRKGKVSGHVFDGHKYVNQLLLTSGLATVDRSEKNLPLLSDLVRSESAGKKK